jgi:parallel beta-helix repeat protein
VFIITNSGSYYLTTNLVGAPLKQGIRIAASAVALDLNGFALIGVSNSFAGIRVTTAAFEVRIHNGAVRNWALDGVDAVLVQNGVFEDLFVANNGTSGAFSGFGIDGGTNSLIRHCQTSGNSAFGIGMEKGGLVIDCLSRSNLSSGIGVGSGGVVRGCISSFNQGEGIKATDNCLVVDNNSVGNRSGGTKAGILLIFSGGTRVENNNVAGNDYGISVSDNGNFIVRNSAHSNLTANYNISGTQTIGPIVSTTGIITTNSPWANFSY